MRHRLRTVRSPDPRKRANPLQEVVHTQNNDTSVMVRLPVALCYLVN